MGTAWVPAGPWTGEPQRDGEGGGGQQQPAERSPSKRAVGECAGVQRALSTPPSRVQGKAADVCTAQPLTDTD